MKLFIISFNRLSFLKRQVEFFQRFPTLEIIIVDNASNYMPLREYLLELETSGIQVLHMPQNYGHRVVWFCGISQKHCLREPYIVTDSDVLPDRDDFLSLLETGLAMFPQANKIGLGLRINDIPHNVAFRSEIIGHERGLFRKPTQDVRFESAAVDTTLAIYRSGYHHPSVWGYESNSNDFVPQEGIKSIRTTYPWTARHLSWYITMDDIQNEENQFYLNSIETSTHWSQKQKNIFK